MSSLFPSLTDDPAAREALRFGDRSLTYRELAAAAGAVGARVRGRGRVAVWATPTLHTAVAVVGTLLAGVAAVPLNPKSGEKELGHIVADSAPAAVWPRPAPTCPACWPAWSGSTSMCARWGPCPRRTPRTATRP